MKVVSDPRMKALPFDLKDVEITDGPFRLALELDHKYLLELDCNRLLARFREYAGLKPKAPHYDGWEASTLSGHSLGHYLSACCMMYDATGDEALKHRIEYIFDELEACQSAHGDGYVSAIPRGRELFAEVASGNIRSKGFDLNDGWAPLYTLHKLMAGLRDAYRTIGSNKALAIETGLADWLKQVFINLSDEQMQDIMRCEFGGMNEVLADIYLDTSDEDALALAARFYHHDVLDPLAESKDCLKGKHANTQIPKLIGLLKQYQCTGDESLLKTAKFFWDRVVNHHSYVTGGNSNGEYFGSPDSLNDRLSLSTTETCNTYNMLKLSALLFQWDTSAEIADYCERALYNHILASIDPETGGVCYFLSLAMGGIKISRTNSTTLLAVLAREWRITRVMAVKSIFTAQIRCTSISSSPLA
ncbi:beta-L-arabinofuranosidase domain-containing protein [Alicyclobacillus fastidiosus]|uniref:beta-L-arabinofuranosidase domain-containing protein n=1 Tax=Alicyclobacillus fastidiosus TaxID=392011 RepID=UPI0023E9C697|nr:beta-L-arabinofuranosidase domain-containing protein [Alicyclobacillus fastidiosus]GMA61927.1 hypothetical protein GCM10025859_23670 [Alicyclobacillus fastidiosus]